MKITCQIPILLLVLFIVPGHAIRNPPTTSKARRTRAGKRQLDSKATRESRTKNKANRNQAVAQDRALSRLRRPTLPRLRTRLSRPHHHGDGETQLHELVHAFEPVLVHRGVVDTSRLLRACHTFAAAMRRTGQNAVARDLENNIDKAEELYHSAPHDKRRKLSDLLEYERDSGIHGAGGVLLDPSGAVGFLWIRRSIALQAAMYGAILRKNTDPTTAALDAYRDELRPYHGWALRRVYTAAFSSGTPPREEMLARMGGFDAENFGEAEEKATLKDLDRLVTLWRPLIIRWKRMHIELDLEDSRMV